MSDICVICHRELEDSDHKTSEYGDGYAHDECIEEAGPADPNADLIGFSFEDDQGRTWRVAGSTRFDIGYVVVMADHGTSVRSAALVRRVKMLATSLLGGV